MAKELVVHERLKMKLEMTSTDILNHPNFSTPMATVGTSSYGKILGTMDNDGNRNFQLTLRVIF